MNDFYSSLKQWWDDHRRDFPWRRTKDPYKILIAEVLLHRTRAEQVVPIYEEFIQRYPTPASLAGARKDDIVKLLHPLGLTWRASLLHEMAKKIDEDGGIIKNDREWLLSLPGVSDYIAGAVMCFAFGEPEPLLDANTVRIVGRIHNVKVTDGSRRSRKFQELYRKLMNNNPPQEFNLAMIDLGALVCRPQKPLCPECPLKKWCEFYSYLHKTGKIWR